MIVPKLNISDLSDICRLSMNSGAIYPLQAMKQHENCIDMVSRKTLRTQID
jgi:hypothetical protein